MAFCSNCGTNIEDETKGCPVCNSGTEESNETTNQTKANVKDVANKLKTQIKNNKKRFLAFGAVAIVLVVLIVAVSILGSYERAIDTYIDVVKGKFEKIEKMAPPAYWDYFEDTYDMDVKDLIENLKDASDSILDDLEEEYGDNIKISYKVTDADQLDKDDLKEIKDSLKDRYDIAKKSVTDAYELDVELKIVGSEDEDEEEMECYAVKIDGKWYLISESYRFMVPSI